MVRKRSKSYARRRAPPKIIERLEAALRYARMDGANFGPHDAVAKEATRIYRETWLIPNIQKVLDWAKGWKG